MSNWGLHKPGEDYDAWPKTAGDKPEEPAFLVHCSPLDMEADMVRSMLKAFGIPSVLRYPGDGAFGKVMLGLSGSGADIYVPASMLADAKELLKGEPEDDGLQEGI